MNSTDDLDDDTASIYGSLPGKTFSFDDDSD